MTPTETVLNALEGLGLKHKQVRDGWQCCCPAHEDRTPSLSIKQGDCGSALLHCHAGCSIDSICDALKLSKRDLFTRDDATHAPRTDSKSTTSALEPKSFSTARDALAELERSMGKRSAHWIYQDAKGDPVGIIVRFDRPDSRKEIRPVSRTEDGATWIIGGMMPPRMLYRLPELLATPADSRVYVVEGEKAVEAARAVGLVATTSPHGSKSAGKADWSPLTGREVVVLPDNDDAGEKYADEVARLTEMAGAKLVRVARLVDLWEGIPAGGDIADFVEHRGGDVDLIRAEVESLTDKTDADTDPTHGPTILAYRPFPIDALPEPISEFVFDAAKSIGCDAAFIALPLLSGLASAIGNTYRIELRRGWTEPAIVWTAIVGESGTQKSPALDVPLRPIRRRQRGAMKEHGRAMREYADALATHERDAAHWRKAKSGGAPPTRPEVPVADRCWTDDTTTEALAVLLNQNPRGLLMVRDELAGWFNFDRYSGGKGGDVAKWLEMSGGREMVVDRKIGGTLYVPHASVSITGGIQPQTLRRALGQQHMENGLAARLLLAYPPRKAKRWTEAEVTEHTEASLERVFIRLFELTMQGDEDGNQQPWLATLSDNGKEAMVRFVNEHGAEQMGLSGDEAAAWSKLEGYAARLALIIHLTRWAANDATLAKLSQVDEVSINAGVVLVRWFANESRRVYAMLAESDKDRETRSLVKWIEQTGGSVTARDLTRGPRVYRNDPERAARVLNDLVATGIGRWSAESRHSKGGRPTDRFQLLARGGDTGDGDETVQNTEDSLGCVAVATVATVANPTNIGDGLREM